MRTYVVICLKIRTFVVSATTTVSDQYWTLKLRFAWKFVPLWYQQQLAKEIGVTINSCDLLENSYLCGISNNSPASADFRFTVVICLKIRTFVVSATTREADHYRPSGLWFAWKFVPLWYQQQQRFFVFCIASSCDLLENSYLCGISNNHAPSFWSPYSVVICLKIRTFVVSATTLLLINLSVMSCDLLENSYLCGISNNKREKQRKHTPVVICLKIRTFVVSATTYNLPAVDRLRCDLLENSYLCGISNNA